jgi:hypothetical protein
MNLRGPAILESWKVTPLRHIYQLAIFEKNPNSIYYSGSRCMTQMNKVKCAMSVKPNTKTLTARVVRLSFVIIDLLLGLL